MYSHIETLISLCSVRRELCLALVIGLHQFDTVPTAGAAAGFLRFCTGLHIPEG